MAGDQLIFASSHRLATSLARAPSLLPLLPPTLLLRLPMVKEGEMEGAVLLDSCISALGHLEEQLVGELEAAGRAALASLGRVRMAASPGELVEGLKGVAGTMVVFIQMAASRYHECRHTSQRGAVLGAVDLARTLLPVMVEVTRQAVTRTSSSVLEAARARYCTMVEEAVQGTVKALTSPPEGQEGGEVVADMDRLFLLAESGVAEDLEEVEAVVKRVVRHGLAVAQVVAGEDDRGIHLASRRLLADLAAVQARLTTTTVAPYRGLVDALELLEQKVNSALLRLAVQGLTSPARPLDTLLAAVLHSTVEVGDRRKEDLEEQVQYLDHHSEQLLQLSLFCGQYTSSTSLHLQLTSLSRGLEAFECELVPAALQLYLRPGDPGATTVVRLVRGVWRGLVEQLATLLGDLVDPTAYMVVLAEEAEVVGRRVRERLYSQEGGELAGLLGRLVSMAERGVDLGWRGLGERRAGPVQPLGDRHPLVRAERSVWEVRASARQLADSLDDLLVHQAALRRVQVLITALRDLVTSLVEAEDEKEGERVEEEEGGVLGDLTPAPGLLSFRAVRRLEQSAAVEEESRREVYRLVHDLTPYSPSPTLALLRRSTRGSRGARRSSAKLDSVLGELSSLGERLGAAEGEARGAARVDTLDTSLRRVVLKPAPPQPV